LHNGCDISNYQPTIDGHAMAAAGIEFCYVLLTDGNGNAAHSGNLTNGYAPQQLTALRAAGIKVGAYQFFRPTLGVGDQVAAFVKAYAACGPFDLPFCIDNETEDPAGWQSLSAKVQETLVAIEITLRATGITYENVNFADHCPGYPWNRGVWLADPSHPQAPSRPCLLQQTGTGNVPGVPGQVDLDVFRGSEADWAAFIGGSAPAPGPSPAPSPQEDDMALKALDFNQARHLFQLDSAGNLWHKRQQAPNPFTNAALGNGFSPSAGVEATVSGDQLHVYVEHATGGKVRHFWSQDGISFGSEDLA
jgi:lysozyme